MNVSSVVINPRPNSDAYIRLYLAADDVIEYRFRLAGITGEYYAYLQMVVYLMQEAARAAKIGDRAAVLDALNAAAEAIENDTNVKFDIYRMIFSLGYECPKHGLETFSDSRGGWHFDESGPWDDIVEFERCSICGKEM